MSNYYVPEIWKDKIFKSLKIILSLVLFTIGIAILFALISFDINDNSFLATSSENSNNLLGNFGSFLASFILYAFGLTGYLIVIFFCLYAYFFYKINLRFFFIRLLFFLISLTLLPQILNYYEISLSFYEGMPTWGTLANKIYLIHENKIFAFALSFFGLLTVIASLVGSFKIKYSFKNLFNIKKTKTTNINEFKFKKRDPIINISNSAEQLRKDNLKNTGDQESQTLSLKFRSPSLEILEAKEEASNLTLDKENIKKNSELLEKVFAEFRIDIKVINVKLGPVITLFEILPAAGIKISTIINLADDISRSMGVGAVRIAQIYGTQYLGVEVPNGQRETVTIKELLSNQNFKKSEHKIPICIGKDISGNIEVIDLSKTPHLLVAGTTGSGKSVFINTLLASILYKFSPKELRLILIDPKMLELSVYNDIAHLLTPVVTEPKKAILALKWVCKEMERRYTLMNEENTRNLESYNNISQEKLPFIVVFIDEMADLMMTAGKEVEHYVQRLAQMARACGIHLVMATQRPSVDIITGSIKANFPSRVSFQVASKYDSRTVLGEIGAEQLLGNGDMLMSKNGGNLIRYQSAFISDNEVGKLINEIKKNQKVEYLEELDEIIKNNDENFDSLSDEDEELITKSIELIKTTNKASTSFLQRNFQIGYNKAARIMETLEERGVVSEPNHAGKRQILIT